MNTLHTATVKDLFGNLWTGTCKWPSADTIQIGKSLCVWNKISLQYIVGDVVSVDASFPIPEGDFFFMEPKNIRYDNVIEEMVNCGRYGVIS